MANMMVGNMWNSYFLTGDLDISMNPYGKDAYGNYRIDDNKQKKKKKNNSNKITRSSSHGKFNTNHKYHLDMIGIWNISEYTGVAGELALGQIINILTNINTVIPQYQIKILDGKHKDKILNVFENESVDEIDPTPYLPDEYLPDEYKSNKTSDFTCDIEALKTDISDLRTDINDLMRDHIDLRGNVLAIKAINPSGDIMLDKDSDCTINSAFHELENKVYDVKNMVDCNVGTIKGQITLQKDEIKKVSKVSKLSLLNSIHNWIV